MNQRAILDPTSTERFDAILKHAISKSRQDPTFAPITLELVDTSRGDWTISGFDVFTLSVTETTEGGRAREKVSVDIAQKFDEFIPHPDYEGMVTNIPSTDHNIEVLATHVSENLWRIHQENVAQIVAARAGRLTSITRDANFESQAESYKATETESGRLLKENEVLRQQLKEAQRAPNTSQAVKYNKEHPERSKNYAERLFNEAKAMVIEEHKEKIEELKKKAKGGKYGTLPEYRANIYPLIVKKFNELKELRGIVDPNVPTLKERPTDADN